MSGVSQGASRTPQGIVRINDEGATVLRTIALSVMIVPFLGFIEAIRLWATGQATPLAFILFGVMYVLHMGGVSMGYHRMLAHRAFKTGSLLRVVFAALGSMAGQGPILFWVATHRRHHAYSDQDGDPHSPNLFGDDWKSKLKGLWHAHMPWMLSPEVSSMGHFAKDIMGDRQMFFIHNTYRYWVLLGLALPAAVGGWLQGSWYGAWEGFVFGGLARMFLANQFAWAVGSVCHMFGGRPFTTHDNSANNWTVAFLTFGEGLQNNHHAFPWCYRHGVKWWEPDISGWLLTLFGRLGLVWGMKFPTDDAIERLRRKQAATTGA